MSERLQLLLTPLWCTATQPAAHLEWDVSLHHSSHCLVIASCVGHHNEQPRLGLHSCDVGATQGGQGGVAQGDGSIVQHTRHDVLQQAGLGGVAEGGVAQQLLQVLSFLDIVQAQSGQPVLKCLEQGRVSRQA